MIEHIIFEELEYAIIIRSTFKQDGIKFITPGSYSQQLGYMNRPAGYVIKPHIHNIIQREIQNTNEVLLVKSGSLRVDFYSQDRHYLESRILYQGDVILLILGGHGFEMIEPTELIEIKQGPYSGDDDKVKFESKNINVNFGKK